MTTYVAVFAMLLGYVALVAAYVALRTLAKLRRATAALTRDGGTAGRRKESLVEAAGRQAMATAVLNEQVEDLQFGVGQLRAQLEHLPGWVEQQTAGAVAALTAAASAAADEPAADPAVGALRNVALVRYDAFAQMSGRMSFSLALLNEDGDGVVLSAIAGTTDTRVYAKGIARGAGEHDLSPEERQAVGSALGKRVGPGAATPGRLTRQDHRVPPTEPAPSPRLARIAYLGPEGTFAHAAVGRVAGARTAELVPMANVSLAIDAVRDAGVDGAVVPLENSVEGAVPATLDELANGAPLVIAEEVYLDVAFDLMARPGTVIGDIRTVATHPHAEAQTRQWLNAQLPHAEVVLVGSTAGGAQAVAAGEFDAAVGAAVAGRLHGLATVAADIADNPGAVTRFVLLVRPRPPVPASGNDRTSLVAYLRADHSGALLEILTEFATRGVNLTRIESRPTKGRIGQYCFSIDCEGHLGDERVGDALAALRRICADVRYLGSYPRRDGRQEPVRARPRRRRLHRRPRLAGPGPGRRHRLSLRSSPRRLSVRSAGTGPYRGLEVQTGVGVVALGGHRVQVALAQQQELVTADLDLVPVVRTEQHPVARLDRPDVVAHREHLGPDQPLGHLGGGRDEDAAAESAAHPRRAAPSPGPGRAAS